FFSPSEGEPTRISEALSPFRSPTRARLVAKALASPGADFAWGGATRRMQILAAIIGLPTCPPRALDVKPAGIEPAGLIGRANPRSPVDPHPARDVEGR